MRVALSFPARLHVLLAAEAPVGVVLRRGPSNAVCALLWRRNDDTFETGQWVRARIYERRCDLSPDGRHLIYFARDSRVNTETRGSYTAISRAPWLKAIVLYGKGNCWLGGGLFTGNGKYWLNSGCGDFLIRDSRELTRDETHRPSGARGAECPSVYYPRLLRDGWLLVERLNAGVTSALSVFEKPLPKGWILRKYAHADVDHPPGSGCYWDEHELEHRRLGRRLALPRWQWADLDRGTLVWAEDGCLFRATVLETGIGPARMLSDFNAMRFEARSAPY